MDHRTKTRLRVLASGVAAATIAGVMAVPSGALTPVAGGTGSTGRAAGCEPGAPGHDHGRDHDHGTCGGSYNFVDAGPWKFEPDPDANWLNAHCKASASETTAPHVVAPLFVYNGTTGPSISDWAKRMREEIYSADRAIAESDPTWHQHLRVACTTNAKGEWVNIWTPSHPVFNVNGDTVTDCGEISYNVQPTYPQTTRRYIYFVDRSLDPTQLQSCSWGSIEYSDTQPGTSNKANNVWGYAQVDPDHWIVSGSSNASTAITLQELFHSWGIVAQFAPGSDGGAHTKDYPDTMNAGRYVPGTATGLGQDCSSWNVVQNMTHKDSFLDCGRDTYWTIKARPGDWLCYNFNLASDSLYLQPRPEREPECR